MTSPIWDERDKLPQAIDSMTADNRIAGGVPMSLEQLRVYLQSHFGKPVVLRLHGTTGVVCPYCSELHYHEVPGRNVAGCDEAVRHTMGIVVNDRTYVPNWGYDVFEYVKRKGVNELIINE